MKKENPKTKLPKDIDDKIKLLIYDAELMIKKVNVCSCMMSKKLTFSQIVHFAKELFYVSDFSHKIINSLLSSGDIINATKYHNKLKQTKIYKLSINQIMKGEF